MHYFWQKQVLEFLHVVSEAALLLAQPLSLIFCDFEVLSPEGVPKLKGEDCHFVALPDVLHAELHDAGHVVAQLVVAVLGEFEHYLIHPLWLAAQQYSHAFEGLVKIFRVL